MSTQPWIRRSDVQFSESVFVIRAPGLSTATVTVSVEWYDPFYKRFDNHAGQYPWITLSWTDGIAEKGKRTVDEFLIAMQQARTIQQYIEDKRILQPRAAVEPKTNVQSKSVSWRVLHRLGDAPDDIATFLDGVDAITAYAQVVELNKEANQGLHLLGGVTVEDEILSRYAERVKNLAEG